MNYCLSLFKTSLKTKKMNCKTKTNFRKMANQINKNLAAELKNFNKDELTETKTSENIVTPVTG